ncbi:MAG: hypothetical protein ACI3V0_05515 [Faecousia sp.]
MHIYRTKVAHQETCKVGFLLCVMDLDCRSPAARQGIMHIFRTKVAEQEDSIAGFLLSVFG